MLKHFLIYLFLNLIPSLSQSENELIKNDIIYNIKFERFNLSSYQIYKYKPKCTDDSIYSPDTFLQMVSDSLTNFYLYDNYSKINQDKEGNFKDYIINYNFKKSMGWLHILHCNKIYYFVFSKSYPYVESFPAYTKFSTRIENQDNFIDISSLFQITDTLMFFQSYSEGGNFIYLANETNMVLINFTDYFELIITENNKTIIYNNKTRDFSQSFEFKKNKYYNIHYKSDDFDTPIYFQLIKQNNYKHNNNILLFAIIIAIIIILFIIIFVALKLYLNRKMKKNNKEKKIE
jgi:hypothetical protein